MEPLGISVLVCSYNRLPYLQACLKSLLNLNYQNYEIIVVNDASTDGTKDYLDNLSNPKIKAVHHQTNQGISITRNDGIKNANYDVIAYMDDDCQADPEWLTELARGFTNEKIGFVIGQIYYVAKDYKGYYPERLVSNIDAKWPMSGNIAYRKLVFESCGYFIDEFYQAYNNEDTEMAIRAVASGWEFNRAPQAIVNHNHINWTVRSIIRSSRNASIYSALKKKFPNHYLVFEPKAVKFGFLVNAEDYLYIILFPILIPVLLIRYWSHGKRDLKVFFAKWPVMILLRRYYIWREAIRNGNFMI